MGVAHERAGSALADVAFEVERVAWPSPDRVEIAGRWFGVRGRRFVRPTLELEVDGEQRRMLALLDHKPWAAEDGEVWVAAFDWDGEQADLAGGELSVGPDVSVELLPEGSKPDGRPRTARRSRASVLEGELREARREAERLSRKLRRANESHLADVTGRDTAHAEEVERLRAELAASKDEGERRAEELRVKLDSERERLRGKLDSERQRVQALADDLGQAREELSLAREEVASARDAAAAEARRATVELEAARREAASARADREDAIRERDRARRERDAAVAAARTEAPNRSTAHTPTESAPGAPAEEGKPAALLPTEPAVPLPLEPPADASRLRRVRPGLYRWERPSSRATTLERALAIGALALVIMILLVFVL